MKHGHELNIWQIADIEYMKFTFIDKDNLNNVRCDSENDKVDLFDYIDSVG